MLTNKFKLIYTNNIRYNSIKTFVSNDSHSEYIICGHAYKYTQVLLARACHETNKNFIFTLQGCIMIIPLIS